MGAKAQRTFQANPESFLGLRWRIQLGLGTAQWVIDLGTSPPPTEKSDREKGDFRPSTHPAGGAKKNGGDA
jgi:hypothetical protein